jgi:hypothetical protein
MARVVMLNFDDNEAAEQFVIAIQKSQGDSYQLNVTDINTVGMVACAYSKVVAVVARPTVWCRCRIVPRGRGTVKTKFDNAFERWTRTERFGWYVHSRCKRPNYFVVRDYMRNILVSAGNNLLQELLDRIEEEEESGKVQDVEPVDVESANAEPAGTGGVQPEHEASIQE